MSAGGVLPLATGGSLPAKKVEIKGLSNSTDDVTTLGVLGEVGVATSCTNVGATSAGTKMAISSSVMFQLHVSSV